MKPVAYRFEWKPADYVFYTQRSFDREHQQYKDSALIYPLFSEPQPECPAEVAVFLGPSSFIQPKYVHDRNLTGFIPLYLGPVLNKPTGWA